VLTNPLEGSIGALDDKLARQIADERTPTLTDAAEIGTYLGETIVGGVVIALTAVVFALWKRTWLPIVFVVLVAAGLGGIYRLGIHVDPRDRPPVAILDTGLDPHHSFPSGHVGTAMAIFLVLGALVFAYTQASRGWGVLLVVVPLACLAARLYQGAHHLSDVLTSVVYAAAWIGIVARLVLGQRIADPASTVSA